MRCTKAGCTDAACKGEHFEPETPKVVPAVAANALPTSPPYIPPVPGVIEAERGKRDVVVPADADPDLFVDTDPDPPLQSLVEFGEVEASSSYRPETVGEGDEGEKDGGPVAPAPVKRRSVSKSLRDKIKWKPKGKSSGKKKKGKGK